MKDQHPGGWPEANLRYLTSRLARIRAMLAAHAGIDDPSPAPAEQPSEMGDAGPSALDTLARLFGLSDFECDLLLLCAGVELDATFAPLCAAAHGDAQRNYPTFSLALAVLPGAAWPALTPSAPLRRWGLIQVEPGRALTRSPLRIDERVLYFLLGIPGSDERLDGILRALPPAAGLTPAQAAVARAMAGAWQASVNLLGWPVLQLTGRGPEARRGIAAGACEKLGMNLYLLPAISLPVVPGEVERFLRLWEREALLTNSALLLECDDADGADAVREAAIGQVVEGGQGMLIVSSRVRRGPWARAALGFEAPEQSIGEQRQLWQSVLGPRATSLNGQLDRLAAQFEMDAAGMAAAWAAAIAVGETGDAPSAEAAAQALWDICRTQSRPHLDDLAQRLQPSVTWNDLVLPASQCEALHEIALQVRQRARVYYDWGFARPGERGLGISALFAGPSGTGKTLAAEVLAHELGLDLYRIDLSSVVSKYIGETEKNLRRVFDAAETSGAVLLFDEADALFGKRSQVKDSHDRYANIEVGYLLQRMEAYRGLAVLTTNLKESLDDAFLRRLRFVVQFPFPDAGQRVEIWRRLLPAGDHVAELKYERLAQLGVPGGNIRNIALGAAFLAAEQGEPVGMAHILPAARREYQKIERALTDSETRGWL